MLFILFHLYTDLCVSFHLAGVEWNGMFWKAAWKWIFKNRHCVAIHLKSQRSYSFLSVWPLKINFLYLWHDSLVMVPSVSLIPLRVCLGKCMGGEVKKYFNSFMWISTNWPILSFSGMMEVFSWKFDCERSKYEAQSLGKSRVEKNSRWRLRLFLLFNRQRRTPSSSRPNESIFVFTACLECDGNGSNSRGLSYLSCFLRVLSGEWGICSQSSQIEIWEECIFESSVLK